MTICVVLRPLRAWIAIVVARDVEQGRVVHGLAGHIVVDGIPRVTGEVKE